jgi:PTH1 family peptidyl-tRNA hydrolase
MILIVGLGNPGREYSKNRHNVGFHCIDFLAKQFSIAVKKNDCQALTGSGTINDAAVLLAKPKTYVNNSGSSVAALMKKHKIATTGLIVIFDDMDLPMGKIRVRKMGSAGGHKGMKSIISAIGSQNIARIKIGIGRPADEVSRDEKNDIVIDHVLSDFSAGEHSVIAASIERAAGAAELIITGGVDAAMNKFN